MFFTLSVLLKRAFTQSAVKPSTIQQNFLIIAGGIMYGGLLELMQNYCYTDRSGSWFDFLANSLGATAGALLFLKLCTADGKWTIFHRFLKKQ